MASHNRIDLTGRRFGRLTVQRYLETRHYAYWQCVCDCGKIKTACSRLLLLGKTGSCGCLAHDLTIERSTTHGLSTHRFYFTWKQMIKRCYDPEDKEFHNYGGRGITVCDEWKDIKAFIEWCDSKSAPDGYTLDRFPNPNGNYEASNCRFANWPQQSRNKRSNVWIEHNGERLVFTDFVNKYSVMSLSAITRRIKRGWDRKSAALVADRRFTKNEATKPTTTLA